LRLWVANTEFTKDVSVGPTVIGMYQRLIRVLVLLLLTELVFTQRHVAQVSDMIRKVRTTSRFMLGSISDFSLKDTVPYDQLKPVS
jgi:isoleucyl-tRNA synthetase